MKKIFALMLALTMIFALAACTPGNTTEPSGSNPTENPVQPSNNPSTPTNGAADPTDPAAKRITEEDVRNHPVTPPSDFTYSKMNDVSVEITGYTGTDEIVVIPEMIDGMHVYRIRPDAFGSGIKSSAAKGLLIPDSIAGLSGQTFKNNRTLEVIVWDGACSIGYGDFLNCLSLHTLVLGDSVVDVGEKAFFSSFELVIKVVPGSFMEQWCKDHDIPYRTE